MKPKKIPLRTCIGCGAIKPKKDLRRIVRTASGQVVVDPSGKLSGRGAYLCFNDGCLERAIKKKRLSEALKTPIGEDLIEQLRTKI